MDSDTEREPFGSLAISRFGKTHGFASPPHDGFAFIEALRRKDLELQ